MTCEFKKKVYETKKDFRVWLVGNPKELGFKEPQEWCEIVSFVAYLIGANVPDKETFAGTVVEWLGGTVYLIESYPWLTPYSEEYKQFFNGGWIEKVKKGDVIKDFAVPKEGEARRIFNMALNVVKDLRKRQVEQKEKLMLHLKEIINCLSERA